MLCANGRFLLAQKQVKLPLQETKQNFNLLIPKTFKRLLEKARAVKILHIIARMNYCQAFSTDANRSRPSNSFKFIFMFSLKFENTFDHDVTKSVKLSLPHFQKN